jgi:diguanylate cyclase (GGDEF)-like protein
MACTIAAVLTCTAVIDGYVRDEARAQATRYLQAHADALRDALDRGMEQHVEAVRVIAGLDPLARGSDPQATRRVLEHVRASFPQFAWLGLTDNEGRVVAAVDGLLQGQSVAAKGWFKESGEGGYVGDVHPAVLLARLLPARAEPWRFVDVATPVTAPDGRRIGVLGAHLSWTWAAEVKRHLVDRMLEQQQATTYVLAADGTVLLGPRAAEGRPLAAASPQEFGVSSATVGSGRYPGLGWQVVLHQPESVAMAAFHRLHTRMALAAGLLCLLLAPPLWLLARWLAQPLRDLAARLDAAGATPQRDLRYHEAKLLADALDRHAQRQADDGARLRELNASLEQRVEQRTAALHQSNLELQAAQRALAAQALGDTLTGLPNRRAFDEALPQALARCRRSRRVLALLFLDIDQFKRINDSHGHAVGDQVLVAFAARLRASVRETDTVARLAGDEFVVLLEGLHLGEEAQAVAQNILAAIDRPFELATATGPLRLDVSTSIGIACEATGRSAPGQLLARADTALYAAKHSGRNTWRVAPRLAETASV